MGRLRLANLKAWHLGAVEETSYSPTFVTKSDNVDHVEHVEDIAAPIVAARKRADEELSRSDQDQAAASGGDQPTYKIVPRRTPDDALPFIEPGIVKTQDGRLGRDGNDNKLCTHLPTANHTRVVLHSS
jgi:hypothetical protein